MELIPQLLFTGLGIGAIYALVALGFVLLIRAASVVNFAQGEFVMLPAFAMLACMSFGAPLGLAQLLKQTGLCASTSEAMRMIDQGGVRIDGTAIGSTAARFIIERSEGKIVAEPVCDIGFTIIQRDSA